MAPPPGPPRPQDHSARPGTCGFNYDAEPKETVSETPMALSSGRTHSGTSLGVRAGSLQPGLAPRTEDPGLGSGHVGLGPGPAPPGQVKQARLTREAGPTSLRANPAEHRAGAGSEGAQAGRLPGPPPSPQRTAGGPPGAQSSKARRKTVRCTISPLSVPRGRVNLCDPVSGAATEAPFH